MRRHAVVSVKEATIADFIDLRGASETWFWVIVIGLKGKNDICLCLIVTFLVEKQSIKTGV